MRSNALSDSGEVAKAASSSSRTGLPHRYPLHFPGHRGTLLGYVGTYLYRDVRQEMWGNILLHIEVEIFQ